MRADLLAETIAGLDEALAAVDAFDQALVAGLLRPRPAQAAGLTRLAHAVAGTPLASRVAEAAEKAAAGAASEDDFVALAAARTAVLGSVHDALMTQVEEATGRPRGEQTVSGPGGQQAANLLAAARSWLSDLGRSGWQGLDNDVVSGSAQVVSAMLPDPALRRLAMLLDGFAAELGASCPGPAAERIPARRGVGGGGFRPAGAALAGNAAIASWLWRRPCGTAVRLRGEQPLEEGAVPAQAPP